MKTTSISSKAVRLDNQGNDNIDGQTDKVGNDQIFDNL